MAGLAFLGVIRTLAAIGAAAAVVALGAPAHAGVLPGRIQHSTGGVLAPLHPRDVQVGQAWGANVDAQIRQALKVDDGNQSPFADSFLAYGIALRSPQGWDDPAAGHYLNAALNQSNPYGLNYPFDAFQNGTVNPASTMYAITLVQLGQVELDAYAHHRIAYSEITAIIDRLLAFPRIKVRTGIGLAYSDSPNDARPGYSVHNVNQGAAWWLQTALDAGVTYRQAESRDMIAGLNRFELVSYQPGINGWSYRDGGSQKVQDPAHAGVGAVWAERFDPSLGDGIPKAIMNTDYGYALGSGVHSSLAQYACSPSRQWLPQYQTYMADPTFQDFGSAAKSTPMMALSAIACGAPPPHSTFTVKSRAALRATKTVTHHYAPDHYGPLR
jgi:hypothetical protein